MLYLKLLRFWDSATPSKNIPMKKSKYQFYEDLGDDRFLHYSASSNSFIIMQKQQHDIFETAAENLPSELLDK